MPKNVVRTSTSYKNSQSLRPALTPEAREQQLIGLAYDLAEQRLLDGTASAQEVTHFLKMGSERAKLEQAKLAKEIDLLEAKKDSLESAKRMEAIYSNAMEAMKTYSGKNSDNLEEIDGLCLEEDIPS